VAERLSSASAKLILASFKIALSALISPSLVSISAYNKGIKTSLIPVILA